MGALSLLSAAVGLASLVCFVIVLIKMFPAEGVLKGILAIICGLYAFIWGWMNADTQGLKTVMQIWTALFVIGLILNVMVGRSVANNPATYAPGTAYTQPR